MKNELAVWLPVAIIGGSILGVLLIIGIDHLINKLKDKYE